MTTTSHRLFHRNDQGISCHAWNADCSLLAVSPNNNEIHIYGTSSILGVEWEKYFVLTEHDLQVSALDWSVANGKLLSCSHDRNAFVWTYLPPSDGKPKGQFVPTQVVLRIDRAALDAKWAIDGLRFAVASSSMCVAVCTYQQKEDWWVSAKIKKKFRSSVTCCAFHPSKGYILATGSSDFRCRIFSAYDPAIDGDEPPSVAPFNKQAVTSAEAAESSATAVASSSTEFGVCYAEFRAAAWINSVAWSPSGDSLAFAAHDSSLHVVSWQYQHSDSIASSDPVVRILHFNELPLCKIIYLSEFSILGGGHDFYPMIFTSSSSGSSSPTAGECEWALSKKLDSRGTVTTTTTTPTAAVASTDQTAVTASSTSAVLATAAARSVFQSRTKTGQEKTNAGEVFTTEHQNCITDVRSIDRGSGVGVISSGEQAVEVSTCSFDGRVVIWDLGSPSLGVELTKLRIIHRKE